MPSTEPRKKPTITSSEVMPLCQSRRSFASMRPNSLHTLEAGGSTKAGILKRPGSHSQAARNTTSTARLASAVLLNKLVGVELVDRDFLRHDSLRDVELLHLGKALRVHGAELLLAFVGVLDVILDHVLDELLLALEGARSGDVIGHDAFALLHHV